MNRPQPNGQNSGRCREPSGTESPARQAGPTDVFALCDEQLTREETLLEDVLLSLRQVHDAFLQRNLDSLPVLQIQQEQFARSSAETARQRDRFREQLSPHLGISPTQVTLRAAALSVPEPARGQLLRRRDHLLQSIAQIQRLTQQNAALLDCARDFFDKLFASLTCANLSERYGPQGERRGTACGSMLVAQG